MGAQDYMVVPSPSYAAPLVGFQLGQAIAGLPDAFMQGREMARTRAKQDAFKEGMPVQKDAAGNPLLDATAATARNTASLAGSALKTASTGSLAAIACLTPASRRRCNVLGRGNARLSHRLPPNVNPQSYQGYVRALDRAVHGTLANAYQASLLPNGAARATQLQEQAKQYAAISDYPDAVERMFVQSIKGALADGSLRIRGGEADAIARHNADSRY
jgi:hypothetical protein